MQNSRAPVHHQGEYFVGKIIHTNHRGDTDLVPIEHMPELAAEWRQLVMSPLSSGRRVIPQRLTIWPRCWCSSFAIIHRHDIDAVENNTGRSADRTTFMPLYVSPDGNAGACTRFRHRAVLAEEVTRHYCE